MRMNPTYHARPLIQHTNRHNDFGLLSLFGLGLLLLLLLLVKGADEKELIDILLTRQEQLVVNLILGLLMRHNQLLNLLGLHQILETFAHDHLHERFLAHLAHLVKQKDINSFNRFIFDSKERPFIICI